MHKENKYALFVVFDVVVICKGEISYNAFDVESYCMYVCASVAIQFVSSQCTILYFFKCFNKHKVCTFSLSMFTTKKSLL